MGQIKVCSKCGEEKPVSDFSKHKMGKKGVRSSCKICEKNYREANRLRIKTYRRRYYKKNKDEILQKQKENYKKNKGKYRETKRDYYERNREKILLKNKDYRETNKDKVKVKQEEWRIKNRDKWLKSLREYRETNKDKVKEAKRRCYRAKTYLYREKASDWRKSNPNKTRFYRANYQANKKNATPNWLTEEQYKLIQEVYTHARECEMLTGDEYHVDHIVPLQGENICGLHVPWNLQVLPADLNLSKSNFFEGGW